MEKTKNLIQKFGKTGFFHIFGGNVINKIVTFLSSTVIVWILSKEEYGKFTYAWNIYSILLLLNGLGAANAVMQLRSERGNDLQYGKSISNYGTRFGLIADGAIVAILLVVGWLIPLKIEGAGFLLRLLCFLPVLYLLYDLICSNLRSQKRNQEYAFLNFFNTLTVFLVSAVGAIFLREKGLILGYYVAYTLSVVLGIRKMKVPLLAKDAPLQKTERRVFHSIAIVSMCNAGLSQLMYLLDVFVIGIVDPEETLLASYKVATIIPSALPFITTSLITYIYPYFAEHRLDGKWCMKQYKKVLLGLGAFNLAVVTVLFTLAPWIISILFGRQYASDPNVLPVFRILTVNYFFSGTFRILAGNLLVTQRKLKFNLFVAILSGTLNIITDFLFITWWGAIGAALTTVMIVFITSVLNTAYLIYTFKKSQGE